MISGIIILLGVVVLGLIASTAVAALMDLEDVLQSCRSGAPAGQEPPLAE